MEFVFLIGRAMFASLFIESGIGHLTKTKQMGSYAKSMGVPAAEFMTFVTGIMIFAGAILVLFDVLMIYGAALIFLFLVPTAFIMHGFWRIEEPGMKRMQQVQFMKDIALAGASLILICFASGLH